MNLDKRLLVPIAMLSVVLSAGMVYAIASFQTVANLTVNEPLTVTPASVDLTLFAGDSTSYDVTVSNAASFAITVSFSAATTTVPSGGSSSDVTITPTFDGGTPVPASLAVTGGSSVTIHVAVAINGAATPGSYAITNTVTKV